MKKFVKTALLFSIPFILIISSYFILDPFKILFKNDLSSKHPVILNRDFVSSEKYIKQHKTQDYNAFIFGSSRTVAFKTRSWTPYIGMKQRPFVFDASGETIYGIWKKVKYIKENGNKIDFALLIFCSDVTFLEDFNSKEHLRIKHPEISKESKAKFYFLFFKTYFSHGFFIKFLDYSIFHKKRNYMNSFLELRDIHSDPFTNDLFIDDQENKIIAKKEEYYFTRKDLFFTRNDTLQYYQKQITPKMRNMLIEIKNIFNELKTDYKIVLSPLYNQKKLDPEDFSLITEIFGSDNVFDYSGINEITNSKYNYYEDSHYRYHVGRKILSEIYTDK